MDKGLLKGIGIAVLFLAVPFLLIYIFRPSKSVNEPTYLTEYIVKDSLHVGQSLKVVSIDTIPPTHESGGSIEIKIQ